MFPLLKFQIYIENENIINQHGKVDKFKLNLCLLHQLWTNNIILC